MNGASATLAKALGDFPYRKGFWSMSPLCARRIAHSVATASALLAATFTLAACNIRNLFEGQAVSMRVVETPKGREAIAIVV